MNAKTLKRAMPGLSTAKARAYAPLLNSAMREGHITTRLRAAAFLAQLGHESGSLRYFEEIGPAPYWAGYSGGARYHGRGPIQLTHDYNYRAAGEDLGLPLLRQPELVSRPRVGFRVAVWFWMMRRLNGLADARSFDAITRAINGGFNGKADRDARYRICLSLGDAILPEQPDPLTRAERYRVRLLSRPTVSGRRKDRATTWLRVQARRIQRSARAQRNGWAKHRRGERFRLIRRAIKRR